MHKQMPRTIRAVPKKVRGRWVGSPRRVPKRAVAAKVVALVTGTARERGASERMAKKVAEAERLMRKGMEYCQMERSFSQLRREKRIFWHRDEFDCGCGVFAEVLRASSQRSAPRRMIAFVAPHITPTAIIFSIDLCWLSLSLAPSPIAYPLTPTTSLFYFPEVCDGKMLQCRLLTGCIIWADLTWAFSQKKQGLVQTKKSLGLHL